MNPIVAIANTLLLYNLFIKPRGRYLFTFGLIRLMKPSSDPPVNTLYPDLAFLQLHWLIINVLRTDLQLVDLTKCTEFANGVSL